LQRIIIDLQMASIIYAFWILVLKSKINLSHAEIAIGTWNIVTLLGEECKFIISECLSDEWIWDSGTMHCNH